MEKKKGSRAYVKEGVWTMVSYADGEALNRSSGNMTLAINTYKANPNDKNLELVHIQMKIFEDAWRSIVFAQEKESTSTAKKK